MRFLCLAICLLVGVTHASIAWAESASPEVDQIDSRDAAVLLGAETMEDWPGVADSDYLEGTTRFMTDSMDDFHGMGNLEEEKSCVDRMANLSAIYEGSEFAKNICEDEIELKDRPQQMSYDDSDDRFLGQFFEKE